MKQTLNKLKKDKVELTTIEQEKEIYNNKYLVIELEKLKELPYNKVKEIFDASK